MKQLKNVKQLKIVLALLAITALGGACNSSSGSSGSSSANLANAGCTFTQSGVTLCEYFDLVPNVSQASVDSACSSLAGSETAACPTANLLGTCANTSGSNGIVLYIYDAGIITSAGEAQSVCTGEAGTWTAQ